MHITVLKFSQSFNTANLNGSVTSVLVEFLGNSRSSSSWITESKNHRMVGVGRDLCGSSSPTSLQKQDHLEQAAQDLIEAGFQYPQRRRLHNPSGQLVPVFHHPQSKEVPPHVQMQLPMLSFVPIAPCPVSGHH